MEIVPSLSALRTMISRHRLLEQISDGVQDKRDLHENLNSSRTTIDRAVRELEDENILHRRRGYSEFTRFGKLAYQEFLAIAQSFETLSNAKDLLSILPAESAVSLELLRGATVVLSDQRAPVAPFRHFSPDPTSDQIQAMFPVLFPQQLKFLCQRAEGGSDIELLVHRDLLPLLEDEYASELKIFEKYSVRIRSATELPQYGVTIVDSSTMWLSVYRPDGGLHGILENTTPESIEHAQQLFDEYSDCSRRYTKVQA
ncbi:hypothetical protein C455_09197 [Haloferax larsenii JCM 13917]|nr:hypothetical protein [Haloferax larsenii]ELZ79750.1 hypothetical protein C455_09197 [Haloferax larsenii JCM 13917]